MNYKRLGKTELMVSEVGFGGEWLERHDETEAVDLVKYAHGLGINIIDCWMPDPKSRDIIGRAIASDRAGWYVQGHIGSTYQNGQYTRTRDVEQCRIAFQDLLTRLRTDYVDLGMIHYVDLESDWETVSSPGPFRDYVMELKQSGEIRHVGLSTHNPTIAKKAVLSGLVEMILFSVNPAFDLMPPTDNIETVCLLSQRKPDTTIEVDLDISELEVSSAETKATYEEIKSYVLKKFGLKVSNLYIAQVKRECGIVERINYNLPKTEGNRVPQCPEDKRKAIKDAFIHFQMI